MRVALVVGVLLISAVAGAEPSAYIAGGAGIGGADRTAFAAMTLEGGYHPGDGPLWVHAELAAGSTTRVMIPSHGRYRAARAGIEARARQHAIIGVIAGVDLGLRHTDLIGEGDYAMEPEYNFSNTVAALYSRLGLDIGTPRVRFRPTLETTITTHGWDGLALAGALALQF